MSAQGGKRRGSFGAKLREVSLQTKLFALIAAVVVFVAACSFAWVQSTLSSSLAAQVESRAKALSTYVASRSVDPLLTNNRVALDALVADTLANNDDVVYVFITNENGEVAATSNRERSVSPELKEANEPAEEHGQLVASARVLSTDAGTVLDSAAPVFKEGGAEVRLGMSYDSVGTVMGTVSSQLLILVGVVLALALAVAYAIMGIALRPVKRLVALTEQVAQGDLGQRAAADSHDEIGRLSASFNNMLDELQEAEAQRAEYTRELEEKEHVQSMLLGKVIRAQEDERKRIARELHDETSHSLTAMLIELQAVRDEGSLTVEQREHAHALKELIDQALQDINELAWNLRPSVLDKFGLQVSLDRYIEDVRAHHPLKIMLVMRGDASRLSPDAEITIYRLVQESITNVIKYAQASEVDVMVVVNDAFVSVVVEDDGVGFDVADVLRSRPGEHLGLLGMDERVSLLGGMLDIESHVGQGTTILAKIPHGKEASDGISHRAG